VKAISIEIIAAVASFLLTLLALFLSVAVKRATRLKIGGVELNLHPAADPTEDSRLSEAKRELERQESIARWNGRADGSLVFGQYIIGGVLASSFVQQSLSPQVIGVLGVLVLLSSLIRQRYRADLQAQGARHRTVSLRTLIREVEDDLFALKNGHDGAPSIYLIRQKVSTTLSKIEEAELADTPHDASA